MHRKFRIKEKVHKKYKPKAIKPDITTQNISPNHWQNSFDTIFLHHHLALKKAYVLQNQFKEHQVLVVLFYDIWQ